jgi:hypothetical protein
MIDPTLNQLPPEPKLTAIALAARDQVEKSGQPVEYPVDVNFKLVLRLAPAGCIQLLTVIYARQPSQAERAALAAAFDVPAEAVTEFDYINGWGVMKLTWPRPTQAIPAQPEQFTQISFLTGPAGSENYYQQAA